MDNIIHDLGAGRSTGREELRLKAIHDEEAGSGGVTFSFPIKADIVFLRVKRCIGMIREPVTQESDRDIGFPAIDRVDAIVGDIEGTATGTMGRIAVHPLVGSLRRTVVERPSREILVFLETTFVREGGSNRILRPSHDGEEKEYVCEDSPHDL